MRAEGMKAIDTREGTTMMTVEEIEGVTTTIRGLDGMMK